MWLQHRDHGVGAQALPGQALHQGGQLLFSQAQLIATPGVPPMELAPVQAAGAQPDAEAVVDQHLHAIAPAVGEQVSLMWLRRTEHLDDSGQGLVRPGAHVQGLGGQPDLVDADHCSSSRNNARH